MREKKYNLLELRQNRKLWSQVKPDLFSREKKEVFDKRKKAVDLYIVDAPAKEIYAETGIKHNKVADLINRCTRINPVTGEQYGYVALIPNKKILNNIPLREKNSTSKTRGSFPKILIDALIPAISP